VGNRKEFGSSWPIQWVVVKAETAVGIDGGGGKFGVCSVRAARTCGWMGCGAVEERKDSRMMPRCLV
jgi:hypothetical protein